MMRSKERFLDYIETYNRGDYDALRPFYTEDVRLVIGNGTELVGQDAIVDFYSAMTGKVSRTIAVLACCADGDLLAAELESEFLALQDFPDFTSGPMAKGDRLWINSFALYEQRHDRFSRIRSAVFKRIWRRL